MKNCILIFQNNCQPDKGIAVVYTSVHSRSVYLCTKAWSVDFNCRSYMYFWSQILCFL